MSFIVVLLSGALIANCQDASGNLRGSTQNTATGELPSTTGFVNVSNSLNETVRVARSCAEAHTLAPGASEHIDLAVTGVRFWVVPSSVEWDCNSPCSKCFYFDIEAANASKTKINVGYGVEMESSGVANSTELQASLPDDHDESAVVGIDLWDDAQSVISSCTTDDCVFDPIVFVQNDGVMNLEIWADEAEGDDDADTDDEDVETAWVGGVARRTGRRVVRRTTRRVVRRAVVPGVGVAPLVHPLVRPVAGVRGVARRTTRRVVRRTTRRAVVR